MPLQGRFPASTGKFQRRLEVIFDARVVISIQVKNVSEPPRHELKKLLCGAAGNTFQGVFPHFIAYHPVGVGNIVLGVCYPCPRPNDVSVPVPDRYVDCHSYTFQSGGNDIGTGDGPAGDPSYNSGYYFIRDRGVCCNADSAATEFGDKTVCDKGIKAGLPCDVLEWKHCYAFRVSRDR